MKRSLVSVGVRFFCSAAFPSTCSATVRINSLIMSHAICNTIASRLQGGDVVQLIGKVGAGKTQIARGMIRSLMQNDCEIVQSPTFSLALSYPCMRNLCVLLIRLIYLLLHILRNLSRSFTTSTRTGKSQLFRSNYSFYNNY
jgi:hypothetical protein